MSKRTYKEIRKAILKTLKTGEYHSYSYLERKVNTNWQTIRNQCKDLELFNAITINKNDEVKITSQGQKILKKM